MYPSTIWQCLHYFTSLDSVCSLRKIRCQPAVFYLHCNRRTEVSQSVHSGFRCLLNAQPSQPILFCSVRAFSDFISNGRNANSDSSAPSFVPSLFRSEGIYIAHIKIVFSEPLCAEEIPLFLLHVWKRLPPLCVLCCVVQ